MPSLARATRDVLSLEAVRHARYIPRIVRRVDPWPRFLLTYMRLLNAPAEYRLGAIRVQALPIDVSTLAVVFIKEDYGRSVSGTTVIDIGANIGAFSLLAAQNPAARVFAFEPVSSTYQQLVTNIALNGLQDRVTTYNMAVAGENGTTTITVSPYGSPFSTIYGDGSGQTESVRCVDLKTALDENAIDQCDILKLDCEGAEFEIIPNADQATLSRIGQIWLEYHERPGLSKDILIRHLRDFELVSDRPSASNCGTMRLTRRMTAPRHCADGGRGPAA